MTGSTERVIIIPVTIPTIPSTPTSMNPSVVTWIAREPSLRRSCAWVSILPKRCV